MKLNQNNAFLVSMIVCTIIGLSSALYFDYKKHNYWKQEYKHCMKNITKKESWLWQDNECSRYADRRIHLKRSIP